MTSALLAVAGVLLLVTVAFDALATTLAVRAGAGPLTRWTTQMLWRLVLRLHRRTGHRGSLLLAIAGPALLVFTVLTWVVLLWAGWTLVFLGQEGSVVQSRTNQPADVLEVMYYVGFTVFTLGVGDYVASTDLWRLVTSVAAFTGLFLITLSITYLVSVVSAVVQKRAIALQVHALGDTAGKITARGWAGDAFSAGFVQHLVTLTGRLAETAEQHLAYPVLNFFHSEDRQTATPLAIAALDEAMLMNSAGVASEARLPASVTEPVREIITRYLDTATPAAGAAVDVDPPPVPDLSTVAAAGVPVVAETVFIAAVHEQGQRRQALRQLVEGTAWPWPS